MLGQIGDDFAAPARVGCALLTELKSMGRKKIEITKILDPNARQVCFSKRRGGLFKKASELSILCGAEIAVLVFSQAGKVFSFGHPNVDYVIDKHLHAGDDDAAPDASQYVDTARLDGLDGLEQHYNRINEELINEKEQQSCLAEEGKLSAESDPYSRQETEPVPDSGTFWWQHLDVDSLERWVLQDTIYALDTEYERVLKHLEIAQNQHAYLQNYPTFNLNPEYFFNPADLYHANYMHSNPLSRYALTGATCCCQLIQFFFVVQSSSVHELLFLLKLGVAPGAPARLPFNRFVPVGESLNIICITRFTAPAVQCEGEDEANDPVHVHGGGLTNMAILPNNTADHHQIAQQNDYINSYYAGRGGSFNLQDTCLWGGLGLPSHYHAAMVAAMARDAPGANVNAQDLCEAVAAVNSIPLLSYSPLPQEVPFPGPY